MKTLFVNLTREKLAGRRIMLYPKPPKSATTLDHCWKPEDGEKADIADVLLRMLRKTTN